MNPEQAHVEHSFGPPNLHAVGSDIMDPDHSLRETQPDDELKEINRLYQVPGQDPISPESFKFFEKAHESLMRKLPGMIAENLKSFDRDLRYEAIDCIPYAPESERGALTKKALEVWSGCTREEAIPSIAFASESERTQLIEMVQESFLGRFFENKDSIDLEVCRVIKYAPEGDRTRLLKKFLDAKDWLIELEVVSIIPYLPEAERTRHIKLMLGKNKSSDARLQASRLIKYAPEADRAGLVELLFDSGDSSVRYTSVAAIEYVSVSDRPLLLKRALGSTDEYVVGCALYFIKNHIPDPEEQTRLYDLAPQGVVEDFFKKQQEYAQERDLAVIPFHEKSPKIALSPEREASLKKLAGTTALYRGLEESFMAREFFKSGYTTTLLGEVPEMFRSLKGRAIIRKMNLGNYLTWHKAFADSKAWEEAGFGHVPIEPIIRVNRSKKTDKRKPSMLVDVAAQVLGPTIQMWERGGGIFMEEIREQKSKIIATFGKMGISYGPTRHHHDNNFCLVFERDETGEIDLTQPPRVYCIDFDHARSVPTPPPLTQ